MEYFSVCGDNMRKQTFIDIWTQREIYSKQEQKQSVMNAKKYKNMEVTVANAKKGLIDKGDDCILYIKKCTLEK